MWSSRRIKHNTNCFRDEDKQSIFGIIETAGDGRMGFNDAVRSLANATIVNDDPPLKVSRRSSTTM